MSAAPRSPAHVLPVAALPRFDLPITPGGLVVGWERGEPVSLPVFRGRPTRLGLFAAAYVGRLLAFRALGAGARAMVATPRPAAWSGLARFAPHQAVRWGPPGSATPPGGSELSPSLIIDDGGPREPVLRTDLGAWQTQVVLRALLSSVAAGQLRSLDAVAVQRVMPNEVPPLERAFDLPGQTAGWLTRLPDHVVGLVFPGGIRFVNLAPTTVERQLLGAPTRRDG